MIFDSIAHLETYQGIDPRIYRGLKLLEQDFAAQEDGTYEVEGRDLYYSLQTYETREENLFPESHRKYVDIQYMLQGAEIIGVGSLEDMELVEAFPERDFYSNRGPVSPFTLSEGRFAVLWPQDAHAPGIATGDLARVRKCVVKVRIA